MDHDLDAAPAGSMLAVCHQAMQSSARALARLLSTDGDHVIVDVRPWTVSERAPEDTACAVAFEVSGAVSGTLIQILTADDVAGTVTQLLGHGGVNPAALTRAERAALAEMGNIVVSAFLNEISAHFGSAVVPSVPDLADAERAAEVHGWLRRALAEAGAGAAWLRADLGPRGPGFFVALAPER